MEIRSIKTTAVAVGSTSALALMAAAQQVGAQTFDGLYMGMSLGVVEGDNPSHGGDPEDYSLTGGAVSFFVGIQRDMANDMFGGFELAYTGDTEGDPDDNSSYEYAYDIKYNIDAKARLGRHMGSFDVYGFGGFSVGQTEHYYAGGEYRYYGVNVGAGAQFNISDNMFAGLEYIHRFTTGEADSEDGYSSDHGMLSLRVGYKF